MGLHFNLAGNGQAGDSCTLQLTVSGVVNGSDPNPLTTISLSVFLPAQHVLENDVPPLNVTQGSQGLAGYVVNRANSTVFPLSY